MATSLFGSLPCDVAHNSFTYLCRTLSYGYLFGEPPFDDLYLGYYLFPGVHLYFIAGVILGPLQPLVGRIFPDFWGAVLDLVILPGFVCAILGGVQWYLIGKLVERVRAGGVRRIAQAV